MTDMELAEEIERRLAEGVLTFTFNFPRWRQIIAALRRGPVTDRGPQVVRYSHGNLYHEPTDIAKPERSPSGEMVMAFLEQFKAASEERWQFLNECEREAAKYRAQGDMWGWNFHMGMSSGANQADLMYQRVYRAMLSAAEASKEAK